MGLLLSRSFTGLLRRDPPDDGLATAAPNRRGLLYRHDAGGNRPDALRHFARRASANRQAHGPVWESDAVLDWAPHGAFRCRGEDNWIAISVQSDSQWTSIVEEMGSPAWATEGKLANAAGRKANEDELERNLNAFTIEQDRYDLMNRLQVRGIAAGVVQKASDRFDLDPQLKARGYYVDLRSTEFGTWPIEGFPARLSRSPPMSADSQDAPLQAR